MHLGTHAFYYFMKARGTCFSKFMEFKVFVENQTGKKLQTL
jgi:hypothetical protein